MCADKAVVKMPSAPRLNFGGHREPVESAPQATPSPPSDLPDHQPGTALTPVTDASDSVSSNATANGTFSPSPEQQAAFLKAVRHVLATTEDVGDRFANQARAMHYGDAEPRSIRGQATPREAMELADEGIDVMALPVPAALKETLQ